MRSIRPSLRYSLFFAVLVCLVLVGLRVFAQQDTSSQSTNSQALPDAPGTGADIQPQIQPEGPTAVFDTSMGRMVCKLYSKESPVTVANFIGLADGSKKRTDPMTHKIVQGKPYFDGTIFHRVIPGFMIQGGDPTSTGHGDPGYFINDELDPSLNFEEPGMLAMANAGPNTNGSQFFITVAPYPSLEGHYSVFGKCDDASVLVAQSITDVERDGRDRPLDPVTLYKVTIVKNGQPLPPVPKQAPAASAPTAQTPPPTATTPALTKRN